MNGLLNKFDCLENFSTKTLLIIVIALLVTDDKVKLLDFVIDSVKEEE